MGSKTIAQFDTVDSVNISSDDLFLVYENQDAGGAPTKNITYAQMQALLTPVQSVNGATGAVVLTTDEVSDAAATNKYVTAAQKAKIDNLQSAGSSTEFLAADGVYRAPVVVSTGIVKVDDITARDALGVVDDQTLCYVEDASGDANVQSGAANYAYDVGFGWRLVGAGAFMSILGGTMTGNLTITGDLTVQGTTVQVDAEVVTADAVIEMNDGEAGAGVTLGYSGLKVDRGSEDDYWFGFDEVRNIFTVGTITALTPAQIATTNPVIGYTGTLTNNRIMTYNSTEGAIQASDIQISGNNISNTSGGLNIENWTFDGSSTTVGGLTYDGGGLDGGSQTVTVTTTGTAELNGDTSARVQSALSLITVDGDITLDADGQIRMDAGVEFVRHSYQNAVTITTNVTGASTINLTNANIQEVNLTGNATLSFTDITGHPSVYTLLIHQDATGGRTITWPGTMTWADGTAPTLSTAANALDIITIVYDGTDHHGFFSPNHS